MVTQFEQMGSGPPTGRGRPSNVLSVALFMISFVHAQLWYTAIYENRDSNTMSNEHIVHRNRQVELRDTRAAVSESRREPLH